MKKLTVYTCSENKPHHLGFWCKGCELYHSFRIRLAKHERKDADVWTYNDDEDSPTFSPSLLVTIRDHHRTGKTMRCHLFLRDGQLQYLGDCTHELAGTTVPVQAEPKLEGDPE